MSDRTEDNPINDAMEILIEHGFGDMDQAMAILVNEAMKIERANAFGARPCERSDERVGHANGYMPKNVKSRLGNLALQIPQVCGDVEFYPSALEKGERSEPALKLNGADVHRGCDPTRKVSSWSPCAD
ncbi:MAG: putative transposase [Verrucomicrobiota bacterium]|nr:putative transposase [Verrucomicrobiota bacterium]